LAKTHILTNYVAGKLIYWHNLREL